MELNDFKEISKGKFSVTVVGGPETGQTELLTGSDVVLF